MSPAEVLMWIRIAALIIDLLQKKDEKNVDDVVKEVVPMLPEKTQKDIKGLQEEVKPEDIDAIKSIVDFLGGILNKDA